VARTDYAANAGDNLVGGEPSDVFTSVTGYSVASTYSWPSNAGFTGVSFYRSKIAVADISDGVSNTYLVGEKSLDSDYYTTGESGGDNSSMFQGFDRDVNRWAIPDFPPPQNTLGPSQDTPGNDDCFNFGSAHAGGFYMTFCDGSTQFISYSIDRDIHCRLANRGDGLPIDASKR
jgi:hypothetical protein